MNQPIGIPSGWEEVAAAMAIWEDMVFALHMERRFRPFSAEDYVDCYHDWREEP